MEFLPMSFFSMLEALPQSMAMLIVILVWWFPLFALALLCGWYLWGVAIITKELRIKRPVSPFRFLIAIALGWFGPFAYLAVIWRVARKN